MRAALFLLIEWLFCYFAISVMMGAYVYLPLKLRGGEVTALNPVPGTQNVYHTVSQLLIMSGLIVFGGLRRRELLLVIVRCRALDAFICLALLSMLWSIDPYLTARRVFTLLTPILFAYYMVVRFPPREAIQLFAGAAVLAGAFSALVALTLPGAGTMRGGPGEDELTGAWCGVFSHKNDLGTTMVVACIACWWLWRNEPRCRLLSLFGMMLCATVIVMTRSLTAQMGLLLFLPIFAAMRLARLEGLPRLWAGYVLTVLVIGGALLIALFYTDTMEALGKDPTLTGRIPLWSVLLGAVSKRPLLGFGYGAFFLPENPDLLYVQRAVGWPAPSAHQGYLDLALQLGLPGFTLGTWILVSSTVRALGAVRRSALDWAPFAAVYLIILSCTSNMFEAMLLHEGDMNCVVLAWIYAALVIAEWQSKAATGRAPITAPPPVIAAPSVGEA